MTLTTISTETGQELLLHISHIPYKYENHILASAKYLSCNETIWAKTNARLGPVLQIPVFFAPTLDEVQQMIEDAEAEATRLGYDFCHAMTTPYNDPNRTGYLGHLVVEEL